MVVNLKTYLRDLRQTAKVKIESLLLLLSRKTMAMLSLKLFLGHIHPWMYYDIKGNGNTIRAYKLL